MIELRMHLAGILIMEAVLAYAVWLHFAEKLVSDIYKPSLFRSCICVILFTVGLFLAFFSDLLLTTLFR